MDHVQYKLIEAYTPISTGSKLNQGNQTLQTISG